MVSRIRPPRAKESQSGFLARPCRGVTTKEACQLLKHIDPIFLEKAREQTEVVVWKGFLEPEEDQYY
jgi:hypothetical protein